MGYGNVFRSQIYRLNALHIIMVCNDQFPFNMFNRAKIKIIYAKTLLRSKKKKKYINILLSMCHLFITHLFLQSISFLIHTI